MSRMSLNFPHHLKPERLVNHSTVWLEQSSLGLLGKLAECCQAKLFIKHFLEFSFMERLQYLYLIYKLTELVINT
jgi:hypothetical protein